MASGYFPKERSDTSFPLPRLPGERARVRGHLQEPSFTTSPFLSHRPQYRHTNRLGVLQDIRVAKPQNDPSVAVQSSSSAHVLLLLLFVVVAIEFNDQTFLDTGKVGNERWNGELASKLVSVESAVAEECPDE